MYLGIISRASAQQMFMRMFAPDLLSWARRSQAPQNADEPSSDEKAETDPLDEHVSLEQLKMLASQFADEIPEDTFTPSQLQGYFQLHLGDVMQAVAGIREWVRQEAPVERRVEVC